MKFLALRILEMKLFGHTLQHLLKRDTILLDLMTQSFFIQNQMIMFLMMTQIYIWNTQIELKMH